MEARGSRELRKSVEESNSYIGQILDIVEDLAQSKAEHEQVMTKMLERMEGFQKGTAMRKSIADDLDDTELLAKANGGSWDATVRAASQGRPIVLT